MIRPRNPEQIPMSLPSQTITQLAASLFEAETSCQPRARLSDHYPQLTIDDAYRISAEKLRLRGQVVTGYKLGYTSEAMRRQMQIDSPNYGVLTADLLVSDGCQPFAALIHPLVEPEIAIQLRKPLPVQQHHTVRSLLAADLYYMAALEVCDTRYPAYQFKAVDNIADNSSAARYVLGEPVPVSNPDALTTLPVELWRNGQLLDRGVAADALGGPLLALAWLANRLATEGTTLKAGDVVLTGGLTKGYLAGPGDLFVNKIPGVGDVSLGFV